MKKIIAALVLVVLLVASYAGIMNVVNKLDQIGKDVVANTTSVNATETAATTDKPTVAKYWCGICHSALPNTMFCEACGQQWVVCAVCPSSVYTPGDGGCIICGDSTNNH